jgi:protein-S-isoprenylcysteine O-methyltransferase Ste14
MLPFETRLRLSARTESVFNSRYDFGRSHRNWILITPKGIESLAEWLFSNVGDTPRVPLVVGLVGLILWTLEVILLFITWRPGKGTEKDRGSFVFIASAWTFAITFSVFDGLTFRLSTLPYHLSWIQFIGIPFICLGFALRIPARRALGHALSPLVQTANPHRLVTTGVYSLIRHPAYLGALGQLVGIALCFGSLIGIATGVLAGIPALVYRIRVEEQALREWFGQEYEQYTKRTCRMIPRLW